MDKYRNFNELKKHEREGADYVIEMRKGVSGVAIIAPHGGGIEPGTVDVADSVAGGQHSFYCFKGIKKKGNAALHLSSDKFDEPNGLKIVEEATLVLAIHGCSETDEIVLVGGKDLEFRKMLSDAITRAGFVAKDNPGRGLAGTKPTNICNRGKTGCGGQIELSKAIRERMFENLCDEGKRKKKKEFFDIVGALRKGLICYMKTHLCPIDGRG